GGSVRGRRRAWPTVPEGRCRPWGRPLAAGWKVTDFITARREADCKPDARFVHRSSGGVSIQDDFSALTVCPGSAGESNPAAIDLTGDAMSPAIVGHPSPLGATVLD